MSLASTAWANKAAQSNPLGRGMYARFSKNRDGQSQSVSVQLTEDRDFFDMQGWPVNEALIFQDDNISASEYSTKERPDFERLCDAIRGKQLWLVVVTEVSRITRAMEVGIEFVKLAQEAGGLMVMTTEGKQFDLMTTTGVHDFLQAVLEASRESGTKSDRFKRNKRAVAKQGRYHGGKRPYGRVGAIKDEFSRVTNKGQVGVAIVESEAKELRDAAERLLDGWPLKSVVRDMNDRGILNASGKPWKTNILRQTLQSPLLIGKRLYDGRLYPEGDETVVPPILDRKVWDELQILFKGEQRMKGAEKKGVRSYLATGYLYCECGNMMTGHVRADGKQPVRTYRCYPYDQTGKRVGCNSRRLAEPLDLLLADAVLYRFQSPGFVEALRQAYGTEDNDELNQALTRAQELEKKQAELEDAYLTGEFDLKQLARMQASVKDELKLVNEKAQKLLSAKGASSVLAGDMDKAWDRSDLHQRRSFMGLITEKVVLRRQDIHAPRPRWTHERTGKTFQFNPDNVEVTFKV